MRSRTAALLVAAALAASAVSLAASSEAKPDPNLRLRAHLSGSSVVPGPGDPDAFGSFELRLLRDKQKVCFIASHNQLAPDNPDLGHIHRAPEGSVGPVVVTLFEGIPGEKSSTLGECAKAKPRVLDALAKHPERFYVDLHTPLFPDGALRGQLFRKPAPNSGQVRLSARG
jgi:hypothetical protein